MGYQQGMNTLKRKKLKSTFLKAAIHAHGWPLGFVHLLFARLQNARAQNEALLKQRMSFVASELKMHPVSAQHPLYRQAQAMARRNGIKLLDVHIGEGAGKHFNAMTLAVQNKVILLFDHEMAGLPNRKRFMDAVIGHELGHAVRNVGDRFMALNLAQLSMMAGGMAYGLVALCGGGAVCGVIAGLCALSAGVTIPALRRSFSRNEEYLADAEGARITGDPQGVVAALNYMAPEDQAQRMQKRLAEKIFGFEHPKIEKRVAFISKAFNVAATGPAADLFKPEGKPPSSSTPEAHKPT